jgi:hypothetical protein
MTAAAASHGQAASRPDPVVRVAVSPPPLAGLLAADVLPGARFPTLLEYLLGFLECREVAKVVTAAAGSVRPAMSSDEEV